MDGPFLVPIAFFAMIAAIVLVPKFLRARERERLHETLRMAFDKGQPVPPELIEALTPGNNAEIPMPLTTDRSARDLRIGIVWLAVGLGFVGIGLAFYAGLYNVGGASETFASFAAIGAIPLFIGVAFLVLSALGRKTTRS